MVYAAAAAPVSTEAASVGKVYSVSIVSRTKKSVKLKWKSVKRATGYQIYCSTKKTKNFKKAKTIKSGSTTKATVTKLTPDKSYYFKIRAVRGSKKGKFSKVVWTRTGKINEVDFVAVGDNLIHIELIESGEKSDGTRDYHHFYKKTKKYIQAADVASINQETVLGGEKVAPLSGFPRFNSPQEIGDAIADTGFDVVTLATNHCMDVGTQGVDSELNYFKTKHPELKILGLYQSKKENQTITYIKKNNIKIALLNYTYRPETSQNFPRPEDRPYLFTNLNEKDRIRRDVKIAKKNADIVIAYPHWGQEYNNTVTGYMQKCCKMFSDLGVDIVIGTHPHVICPVEWVKNKRTGKKMLVYYSLGNYVSFQDTSTPKMLEGMATFTLKKKNGKVTIHNPKLMPMVNYITRKKENPHRFNIEAVALKEYTDEMAKKHLQPELGKRENFVKLYKQVVDKEFRTSY